MPRKPAALSSSFLSKQSPGFHRSLDRFRKRLRELRQMYGLSYVDLQIRSGVTWRQISAIECGEPVNPTFVTLTRLAEALGVEVEELVAPARSGVRRKSSEVDDLPPPLPPRALLPLSELKKSAKKRSGT